MTQELQIPEMENRRENVNNLLDLISRMNQKIVFHQSHEKPDKMAIAQYEEMKHQFVEQLLGYLKELNLPLEMKKVA